MLEFVFTRNRSNYLETLKVQNIRSLLYNDRFVECGEQLFGKISKYITYDLMGDNRKCSSMTFLIYRDM